MEGVPATDQWRVTRAGAGLGKGFQSVTATAVQTVQIVQVAVRVVEVVRERREGSHHLIARGGCGWPGGYRSPIGLVGGSRLLTSDPRDVCFLGGRGYRKPAVGSVDMMKPKPLGPWHAVRVGAPCDVEVR